MRLAFPLLLAAGLLGVHGPSLWSGFDIVPGDQGDARIMAFLLETGWRALLGDGDLRSPPMFFPEAGTRGYTDAHLLWLPVYGALRLAGLDVLRAMAAMFLVLLSLGYAASYVLFRRALGVAAPAAAVGAFVFVFCNALSIKLGHGQMVGVVVLPLILLLLQAGWRRAWLAAVAGGLTGLLLATSYIVGWFFLFFGGIAVLLGAVVSRAVRQRRVQAVAGAYIGGLVAGLAPFIWIYLPQILAGRRRDGWDAFSYRPMGTDFFNLGDSNPVWSGVLAAVGIPDPAGGPNVERFMGASPPVWLLAAIGLVVLFRGGRLAGGRLAMACAACAVALGTALEFRYSAGSQPWQVVLRIVPGASAIRTTFRSELVAMLAVAGLVAVALDRVARRSVVLAVLLGAAALLESAGVHPPYALRASEEARFVATAPEPPQGCKVFALAPQPAGGRIWFVLQSDALMLALHWRIPTINGNSSWTPVGWELQDPTSAGYGKGLARWVGAHGLAPGLCVYDVAGGRFLGAGEQARLLGGASGI
jgi:hypothetical protein